MKQIFLYIALVLVVSAVKAQPADVPYHHETKFLAFSPVDGKALTPTMREYHDYYAYEKTPAQTAPFPEESYLRVSQNVSAGSEAPWIRLRFSDVNLGEHSYLIIKSDMDSDRQYFNGRSIAEWKNQTALFKGNSVEVTLVVAPGEKGITAKVIEIVVGEFIGNTVPTDYLCWSDTRVSSSYENVDGRILPIGCTGWITAGAFYITAGHCLNVTSYDLQVIQFHVPLSLCDGTLIPCAVQDQYPIIFSSRVYQDADAGDDWGIFNVGANSNTGKKPTETERSYYHLSKNLIPSYILVRGYGTDQTPTGCSGAYNYYSQTLQYDIGSNLGEYFNGSYDVYFEYLADTQGGSSGSVLQSSGVSGVSKHAIGVHTHGGCSAPNYGNKGTSFEADDTEAAMNSYWQSNCEYVDEGHHLSSTIGSAVFPHQYVQNALNQADAGHGPGVTSMEMILIAGSNNGSGGVYDESISYSGANNGVTIMSAVGAVVIGPNAKSNADSTLLLRDNHQQTLSKKKFDNLEQPQMLKRFPGQVNENDTVVNQTEIR